jgi:hypothetical protein
MFLTLLLNVLEGVLTASAVCATSQQEYQRLGLCTKTVQRREENGRRPLMGNVLSEVFRIEVEGKWRSPKREVRQNFGGFRPASVKTLTSR